MKLPGYCFKCHKMKRVNVDAYTGKGVPVGVCDECREGRK